MSSVPKVSVLIPTYNYGKFIEDAIDSVLSQTFSDFELIIVDNQSTDNTEQLVKKYLRDERVRYYKNPTNLGMAGNFNQCLRYAKGEYIKFLMGDDKFHPRLLSTFVKVLDENPGVSLVTSYREMFGLKSKVLKPMFTGLVSGETVIAESVRDGRGNWLGEPTTVMFRKADLRVGDFDASYTCMIDLNMWLRILTVGDCYIVPEILSYFRIHVNQFSTLNDFKNRFDEYRFYKKISTRNEYHVDLKKIDIQEIIRTKAMKSAKVMFLMFSGLHHRRNRKVFRDAFKIAANEKIIMESLEKFIGDKISFGRIHSHKSFDGNKGIA